MRAVCLPILISLGFPVTFLITYSVAYSNNHISSIFVFISDTSVAFPETHIFNFLVSGLATITLLLIVARYIQIRMFLEFLDSNVGFIRNFNIASIVLGLLMAIGVEMVASFPGPNAPEFHLTGAFLSFLVGAFYIGTQTYLSWKMLPVFGQKSIVVLRGISGVSCFVLFFATYFCGLNTSFETRTRDYEYDTPYGRTLHIIAVVTEWLITLAFECFMISMTVDFKDLIFDGVGFKFSDAVFKKLVDYKEILKSKTKESNATGPTSIEVSSTEGSTTEDLNVDQQDSGNVSGAGSENNINNTDDGSEVVKQCGGDDIPEVKVIGNAMKYGPQKPNCYDDGDSVYKEVNQGQVVEVGNKIRFQIDHAQVHAGGD